jgi:tRNA (guanine-N7-)-methyltransferase
MESFHRTVRSYVIRAARLTPGQKRALEELYPVHGVPFPPAPDLTGLFPTSERRVVEIGFGNGEATLEIAKAFPGTGFLGIEVHPPGVGHLLAAIEREGLTNLKVLRHDAVEVIGAMADQSVDAFHVFFPDPWQKKKHHKRRLLQTGFLVELARVLKPGGVFYFASDWEEYAEEVLAALSALPVYANDFDGWAQGVTWRPSTRFERRGLMEQRPIREVQFHKVPSPEENRP